MRIFALAALTAVAAVAPMHPAQAEFLTFEELRGLCRGETAGAGFRTGAAHRLLAETYRARCRMYLLGRIDGFLQERAAPCARTQSAQAEAGDALVDALLNRAEPPDGGIAELVRDVVRSRYGCE